MRLSRGVHFAAAATAPHAGRLRGDIDDGYTLVPLDRPTELARPVREFTRTSAAA
jgi:hypothetical protein